MADEELLCKPTVWVDLLVWNPEPLDWGFALPTCQAPLWTLNVKALGPRRVVLQWVSPSTLRRRSLGSCGYVGLVLNLGVLWRWILNLGVSTYSSFKHLETPCVGYGSWHLCSRLLYSTKPGERAALFLVPFLHMILASVVVDFEVVQFRDTTSALGVGPQSNIFMLVSLANSTWHRPLQVACWIRNFLSSSLGRSSYLCRVLWLPVSGRWWFWDFLKYVITDTWNYAIVPGPPLGDFGNVGHEPGLVDYLRRFVLPLC